MSKQYWCMCCDGNGKVDEVVYRYEYSIVSIPVLGEKKCPGCDGFSRVGLPILRRAEIERAKDML